MGPILSLYRNFMMIHRIVSMLYTQKLFQNRRDCFSVVKILLLYNQLRLFQIYQ
jgi:hypothetical protein